MFVKVNCSDIQEFKKFNFQDSYSFNFSNFNIGADWDAIDVKYLAFELNYCSNKSYCKNISETKNFFKNNEYSFNLGTMIKTSYAIIDPELKNWKEIFISQVNVMTDSGLIIKMKTTKTLLSSDNEITYYKTLDPSDNDSNLDEFQFYLNSQTDNFTFIKLQSVFASLGDFQRYKNDFLKSYDKKIILVNKLFDFSNLDNHHELKKIKKRNIILMNVPQ